MTLKIFGKALSIFGISPSVVEVFFVDHEEMANRGKFANHLATHGISFDTDEEYNYRLGVFTDKDKNLKEINGRQSMFTVGHNHLSTLTSEEAMTVTGNTIPPPSLMSDFVPLTCQGTETILKSQNLPADYFVKHFDASKQADYDNISLKEKLPKATKNFVNWEHDGYVNKEVQNQGDCGACWSFAIAGAIESQLAIEANDPSKLTKLSEQQLINCAPNTWGCLGAQLQPAFYYTNQVKIKTQEQYSPYEGKKVDGASCPQKEQGEIPYLTNFVLVESKSPEQLKAAIERGLVILQTKHFNEVFKHYKDGILHDHTACNEGDDQIRHSVLAVGFGTRNNVEYVTIRNSWGQDWGNKGYINIALNNNNVCEILSQPYYVKVV